MTDDGGGVGAALVDVLLGASSITHLRELLDDDQVEPELTAAVVNDRERWAKVARQGNVKAE